MGMAKIAIIETGGKQYLVTQDSVLNVDPIRNRSSNPSTTQAATGRGGAGKITAVGKTGDKIVFDKVLLVDDGKETKVGSPYVEGAVVSAELVEEGREKKVTVIRYRQKSRYFKNRGHRQPFAKVRITALP